MLFPTEKHLQEFHQDKFGYKSLSKKILDNILLKMELPNCFGLYGNWGSGKSTIIHYITKHLQGPQRKYKKVTPVYFEPWKYEYSDQKDLLFALLNKIKMALDINNSIWKKIMVDSLVITSGVLRLTKICDIQDTIADFDKIEDKVYKEYETWIDKIEEFKSTFQQTINEGLKKRKTEKLIIFVDDLDRCLPENAVKLLEGIKNFLSTENTLFVLAIDKRVISEMIEKKYGLHQGYGSEYIMKIIHYYYELQKIDLKEVVHEILESYNIISTERQKSYITEFLQNFGKEPRVTKHILHQLCMKIYLSKKIQETINPDESEKQLQYLLIAFFLTSKFPKLFLTTDSRERFDRLMNIRDGAAIQINHGDPTKYKNIIEKDTYINPKNRKQLESIFQYAINKGNESQAEKIVDIAKLNSAIELIK